MTDPALAAERASASFSASGLRAVICGSRPEKTARFAPLFAGAAFDSQGDPFLSYSDLFEAQLGRAAAAVQVIRANPKLMATHQAQKVQMADLFETGSLGIHFVAFLPFLRTQANEEQKKKWLPGALEAKYWGAYAQTELGHGSNVRALETLATFDKATDEFVIHSPTLSSMKWWPTGMYSCTHAIVFCQLLLGDGSQSRGVFGFFVQLRDEHGCLMPGVEVGEIGPKVSTGEANIGYARFDHVRVPHSHLVAKHITVSRNGTFQAAPPKLSRYKYVGMMNIRVMLVRGASVACGKAACIAIRFSAVRRQGFLDSKAANALAGGEAAILDYCVQQRRLFTALGASYLLLWTGRAVVAQLKDIVALVESGNETAANALPEMHATCAGLKAHCTTWASALVEDCRKCCGGQGFLRSSGIADLSTSYVGAVTAEGEAVVLALQTARFLIKSVAQARRGESVAGAVAYVADVPLPPQDVSRWGGKPGSAARIDALVALHRDRARRVALELADDFVAATESGLGFDAALNSVAVAGLHANECHCVYVMAENARSAMPALVEDEAARAALATLLEFTLLEQVEQAGGDFAGITLDRAQMRAVRLATNEVQALVRPDAVALCDSLGYTDAQLGHSTLGREDGQVYQAIYNAARRSPLNSTSRMTGWDKLAPVVDMDFLRAGARAQRQGDLSTGPATSPALTQAKL